MLRRALNASWPLVDQGVVSIGTFVVNLVLARTLPQAEYGVFALLISVFLTLQLLNSSLIFHPVTVSLPLAGEAASRRLSTATCLLTLCTSLPLAGAIGLALHLLGRGELIPYALAAFLAAQAQEAPRRCLFAALRHRTALPGDGISYLGQAVLILLLVAFGMLGIENALLAMAGTSLLGMALQIRRIRFAPLSMIELVSVTAAFWEIGRWILAYSAISFLRLQICPWALAATSGPSAAAMFQAAMNLINVANPVVLGLSNIVPQIAAKALRGPDDGAAERSSSEAWRSFARSWRTVRFYPLLGLPAVAAFYGLIFVAPSFTLRILYSAQSEYMALTTAVQILAVSALMSYGADTMSSFLHGVNAARVALAVNVSGAAVVVACAAPVVWSFGLTGACVVLAIAGVVRFGCAGYAIRELTQEVRREPVSDPLSATMVRSR